MYKAIFKIFMISIISVGLTYCSADTKKSNIIFNNVNNDAEILTAKISITGMSCQYSCVSSVNKSLNNTDGVESVVIDFDENNETDFATVTYNTKTTTPETLIKNIESIGDHSYSVSEVIISDNVTEINENKINNNSKDDKTIALPQLNILRSLINLFGSLQA
jgi:copper chaperone CopZ